MVAGGVLITKVKLLSAKAVMTTRQWQTRLDTLGLGVERLAELHDVQTTLTQRGADRRRRIGLTSWHLQLDEADDFLRHVFSLRVSRGI